MAGARIIGFRQSSLRKATPLIFRREIKGSWLFCTSNGKYRPRHQWHYLKEFSLLRQSVAVARRGGLRAPNRYHAGVESVTNNDERISPYGYYQC